MHIMQFDIWTDELLQDKSKSLTNPVLDRSLSQPCTQPDLQTLFASHPETVFNRSASAEPPQSDEPPITLS